MTNAGEAQVADASGTQVDVLAEDVARANLYRLIARFLDSPPSQELLLNTGTLEGDDSPLGVALANFASRCGSYQQEQANEEYLQLFIGMVRGEILPYASYYLTGFLHEKPLAKLRKSLHSLGIERDPLSTEPEDHAAAILDVMAGLILGDYGEPAPVATQKEFFEMHLSPWASHFFKDLEEQKTSELYASFGTIGKRFMEVEQTAFQMD